MNKRNGWQRFLLGLNITSKFILHGLITLIYILAFVGLLSIILVFIQNENFPDNIFQNDIYNVMLWFGLLFLFLLFKWLRKQTKEWGQMHKDNKLY